MSSLSTKNWNLLMEVSRYRRLFISRRILGAPIRYLLLADLENPIEAVMLLFKELLSKRFVREIVMYWPGW